MILIKDNRVTLVKVSASMRSNKLSGSDACITSQGRVNTFGRHIRSRYGMRVHKVAINAGFTCPNRDGSKGWGGCSFCNNRSFSPNDNQQHSVTSQINAGRTVIRHRTGARHLIAYFQAYTNTYADIEHLRRLYDEALSHPAVVGLAVGTRPDCVPAAVLDLLAEYRQQDLEVWLELGLQSSFDRTLDRVNRGHDFSEYRRAVMQAHARNLDVCTHLIIGLPGEGPMHARISLQRVLELGVEGLKLHPLHVVRNTLLARQWRQGDYQPLCFEQYVQTACDLIELTPPGIIFHRLTASAPKQVLLAPDWCAGKWSALNAISEELKGRGSYQGSRLQMNREVCQ